MLKKLIIALLVTGIMVSMMAGCAKDPSPATDGEAASTAGDEATPTVTDGGKTLIWNNGFEPTTIDPGTNSGEDAAPIILHMYEGLLKELDNQMVPGMAESYDASDDLLTYIFHLRDAKWSDGQPVRAQDFEFAWNRVIDPEVASPYSWIFEAACIEEFKAIDEKTFEVKLSSPAPYFLNLMDTFTFMPLREDKIDYTTSGWSQDPAKNIGNGAFKMESYVGGDRIVLVKNPEYYEADLVKLDRIEMLMITDGTTALSGYEAGQIDVLKDVPPGEIPRLLNEDPNFSVSPMNRSYFYCFNIARAPFDDIRVRKALNYAIDRNALVNDVTKGGEAPAHSLIPGVMFDSDGNQFNVKSGDYGIPYDLSKLDEAKALLAEAGFPNGEGFPEMTILYNTDDTAKVVSEAIQQMWKANLGIDLRLVNEESAVFHTTRVAHNFDICRGVWGGDYNDPLTYFDLFVPGSDFNYAGWNNDEYNKLVAEGKKLAGTERFEKFYAADKLLMEDHAYIPLFYDTKPTLVNNDKVTGWFTNTKNTYNFIYADIA